MEDYVLIKKSKETQEFAQKLGYSKVFFSEDFVLLKEKTEKELLKKIREAHQRKLRTIYVPESEEMLRFALEKSDIDLVCGLEHIHPKDSFHFTRGGLDQVLCVIAAEKDKTILFSFADILHSSERGKLLARMRSNIKLCRKYKVKMQLISLASAELEMRSAKDLEAFGRILGI